MAQVRTANTLALIDEALETLFKEKPELSGVEEQKKFEALAEEIAKCTSIKLKPDTLYKNMALRLRREDSPVVGFHKRYLNGLAQYVHGKNYYEVFHYEKDMAPISRREKHKPGPGAIQKEQGPKRLCYIIYTLGQVQEANHLYSPDAGKA